MTCVPPATAEEIAQPAAPGGRHAQAVKIACSLAGNGIVADAIFAQLRAMYTDDVPNSELREIVEWATRQNFTPSGGGLTPPVKIRRRQPAQPVTTDPSGAVAAVEAFLNGCRCTDAEVVAASPVKPKHTAFSHAITILQALFRPDDLVNIVTDHVESKSASGTIKYNPKGYGDTKTAADWISLIEKGNLPVGQAGAWLRMNSLNGRPPKRYLQSNIVGVDDENVCAHRFALVEFDAVPLDLQLSFLRRVPVPIAAIITSGGKSIHGWVVVNAATESEYDKIVAEMLALLAPYGVDQANRNPSRLSRLPGAVRRLGGAGDGAQRLLFCDPAVLHRGPLDLGALREAVKQPKTGAAPTAVLRADTSGGEADTVEIIPDEPRDDVAVYAPPAWDEVMAAVDGSPLAAYLDECRRVGDIPPTFCLADAILFGCLLLAKHDRRIGVQDDHAPRRCNAYVLHLGASGTGKGFSSDILLHLCEQANVYRLGGRSAAYLAHRCNETDKVPFHARFGLYRIAEVKSILSPKDPVGSGLATTFLQAYDEGIMEWSTAPNGRPKTVLVDPFAPSLLLEGQPDLIESSVGSTNLDAGFLARFLVASARTDQRARKIRGFNADRVLAAYGMIGRGPRIVRPPLPESPRLAHCALDGALRSAWSRLHGDYLPRFAALLDPAGTAKGQLDPSALDRALVLAEFFLGESVQLIGLVHGDRLAMLVARFERHVTRFPGSTDRSLYRTLSIDCRTFKVVADTAIARESVWCDYETTGHQRRRWYPTTVSQNCQNQSTDTYRQAGVAKTLSAVDHSTPPLSLMKEEMDGGGVYAPALTAEIVGNQPQNCQTPSTDTTTDTSGGSPVAAPEPPPPAVPASVAPPTASPDAQPPSPPFLTATKALSPAGGDTVSRCEALFPGKQVWVYDCETYPDFFLAAFTNGRETIEFDDSRLDDLRQFVTDPDKVLVGFNYHRFDDVLLKFVLTDSQANALRICNRAEAIIGYKNMMADNPKRQAIKELTYKTPIRWHRSVDLAQHLAKGETDSFAGLKVYATRLRMPDIIGLPYPPGSPLGDDAKKRTVREYCRNDLRITLGLLERGLKLIEMRVKLETDHGINLQCASEARIAEEVMAELYGNATGRTPLDLRQIPKPTYPDGIPMGELLPAIKFQTPELQAFHGRLQGLVVTADGGIGVGDELQKRLEIEFGGHKYAFALGGLHSVDKRAVYRGDDGHKLIDFDVASFYPATLVKQTLYPAHLSSEWSGALDRLMQQRLQAKRSGDKATADSLKIVINATFGKCGDRFSWMYDPRTKFRVTVGGQMQMLALIEAVTLAGVEVISANTDGITCWCPVAAESNLLMATKRWQTTTGFELERTDYRLYARRDVNNYIAISVDGKVKTKGAFSDQWQDLGRKHDANIVAKAVIDHYRDGTAVEQTINRCDDLYEFLRTYRRSHLRTKITWRGKEMQDNVRWYVSVAGDPLEVYSPDGRKSTLADGGKAMVCNRIEDTAVPADLDRQHYIAEAHEIIDPPRTKRQKAKTARPPAAPANGNPFRQKETAMRLIRKTESPPSLPTEPPEICPDCKQLIDGSWAWIGWSKVCFDCVLRRDENKGKGADRSRT